jgi:hypothetical protein
MPFNSCIPIIPSADLEKSLRLWVEGLGFAAEMPMRDEQGKMVFCMLHQGPLYFMLNQRAGTPDKPGTYEGIRLYCAPDDLEATRQHLLGLGYSASGIVVRDYGQAEFFLTDDDGFTHCFGVPAASP